MMQIVLLYFQISLPFPILCQGTFECGSHGRFEYCIDEIPGCVIGCHCHPGYYFDTDTKICEPNSKIIAYHRRNNEEPRRVHKSDVTPSVIYDSKLLSTTNKVDSQVDEITKDANDLGDWLYNQFFKTIENQVVNKTNDKDVFTRRSGSQDPMKTNYRRKKGRNEKLSKQRGKKKHLRRKLLRITENDSLFDLSSKSSSDSSDSSSSDSSIEYETNEYHQKHDDDDEHGHKKIVMINKKPKQQLPSFIFLPNLDTPFYPPIGLPPPPIIPMYPVVPIPPVPMYPVTGCDEAKDKQSTSMAINTTSTTTARSGSKTTGTSSDELESTTATIKTTALSEATDAPNSKIQSLRIKNKKKKKKGANISSMDRFSTEQGLNNFKSISRQKILQRLKENMNNPSANLFMPSLKRNKKIFANTFVNHNADVETPYLDNKLSKDEYTSNEIQPKQLDEASSFPDNVDFKYITELIHRVDLTNKSNNLPHVEYNPNDSIEIYRPSKIDRSQFADFNIPFDTPDTRRLNHPSYHQSDETYYTNLGRQIAKMIRRNPQYGQVNIQLDETANKGKNHPYFNNNSARSFWERSVRSPLTLLKANNKKFEYMKKSNELLFDIENKVEIIVSTSPPLSLQEIENIVNVMEVTKKQIQNKDKQMRNLETFDKNLTIDLWPEFLHKARTNLQNSVTSLKNKDWERKPIRDYKNNNHNNNVKSLNNIQSIHMHSIKKLISWNGQNGNENTKSINQSSVKLATLKPLNIPSYFDIYPNNKNIKRPYRTHEIPEKYNPFFYSTVKQSQQNQHMNPSFLRHRKYFQDNNNWNVNQNEERIPSTIRFAGIHPSYFHHEINNFDFIE